MNEYQTVLARDCKVTSISIAEATLRRGGYSAYNGAPDLCDRSVNRCKFHGGTWRYLTENLDFPYYLLRDRLAKAEGGSADDLKFGEGKILKLNGKKAAAYRAENGRVHLLSPVCTHLKCLVHWNEADKTWDCPCHGSRF